MKASSKLWLAVALFALSAPASAEELDTRHYIYIEATATVSLAPEYAMVSATAKSKAPTPDAAVDMNNKLMDKVLSALVSSGVMRSNVETKDFGFEKVYVKSAKVGTYDSPDPDRDKFDGYRVTNSFNVKVVDLTHIGDILGIISRNGVEIDKLTFSSSKIPGASEKAQQQAVADAFRRAQNLAAAGHTKLGTLLQMRNGTGYNPETMEPYPVDGEADLMTAPLSGVVPATIKVGESISAKWEVLPLDAPAP